MHIWKGADGLEIAGDAWGPKTGRHVFLLHGGGQTRHAWKGAGETLAEAGYRAIAFDARGHGDSAWASNAEDYSGDKMVEDLTALIASEGAEKPALVGASMGGGTSLLARGFGHVNAAALVLVDIAPQVEPEGVAKIQAFMDQKPDGFESLEEVAEAISNYQPHRKRPRTLDGLAKNVRISENGKYVWHWDPKRRQTRAAASSVNPYRQQLSNAADHLSLPTLLVRGGLSDVLSEAGAQAFLKQCPHAEYVNVKDAAHMVAGDRNDIFADSVVSFLKRTASPN
jgi:non-heme chloroperoxidase